MKYFFLYASCALLAACASPVKNSSDLAKSEYKSDRLCVSATPVDAAARIHAFLRACYQNRTNTTAVMAGNVPIPIQTRSQWRVMAESVPDRTSIAMEGMLGYTLRVDVERGRDSCGAEVQGYAFNSLWARRFVELPDIAEGRKVECWN